MEKEKFIENIKKYNTNNSRSIVANSLKKHYNMSESLQHLNNIFQGKIDEIPESILKEIAYGLGMDLNEYFPLKDNENIKKELDDLINQMEIISNKINDIKNNL